MKNKKKIILTGGTRGIGRAILEELSKNKDDYKIVTCSRNEKDLKKIEQELGVKGFQLDLDERQKISSFVKKAIQELGRLNILVLNAGTIDFGNNSEYVFSVNRDAQIELVNKLSRFFVESGGFIVFMTSTQSQVPLVGHEYYGLSKRDTENFLKIFSKENKNIKVIFINPGTVDTDIVQQALNSHNFSLKDRALKLGLENKIRNVTTIGKIVAKIIISRHKFNPQSFSYDLPIENCETIDISDENIKFEESLL